MFTAVKWNVMAPNVVHSAVVHFTLELKEKIHSCCHTDWARSARHYTTYTCKYSSCFARHSRTTIRLDFPSMTELAAQAEFPLCLSYYLAVRLSPPSPPTSGDVDRFAAVGLGASTAFSPSCFGGPDNQAAVRVKGREKEEEKI